MSTSDRPELRIDPTTPAGATDPVGGFVPNTASQLDRDTRRAASAKHDEPAVATAGRLRPAYAQYVVDPRTHEVSVRIRDAATDQVIDQIPSADVLAMERSMREYAEALARKRAAAEGKAGA